MTILLYVTVLATFVMAVVYRFGRRFPRCVGIAGVAVMLVSPFLFENSNSVIQLMICGYALIGACKAWEFCSNTTHDPAMWESPGRFIFWWIVPPESTYPRSPLARVENRREGCFRSGRGLAKAMVFVGVLSMNHNFPNLLETWGGFCCWSMALLYTGVSGLADLICGSGMLCGIHVDEAFLNPFLSRNCVEFWNVRWNRFVHRFARRHFFWAFGGRQHSVRATLLVFSASGVMHEYVLIACMQCVGSHLGWMFAFFVAQGLATIYVGIRMRNREPRFPRTAAVACHIVWMLITSPLFFLPLDEATRYSEWW